MPLGTPIKSACVERWDGPDDANVFCPCCGIGWLAAAPELEQAERSWAAYEAEMAEASR